MKPSSTGFTLIEVMIALTVVVIAVLAMLSAAAFSERSLAIGAEKVRAESLIAELVEEIRGMPREEHGTDYGASRPVKTKRSEFKSVLDYRNLIESPPRDFYGAPVELEEYEDYHREVKIAFMDPKNADREVGWGTSALVKISITVARGSSEPKRVEFFRSLE